MQEEITSLGETSRGTDSLAPPPGSMSVTCAASVDRVMSRLRETTHVVGLADAFSGAYFRHFGELVAVIGPSGFRIYRQGPFVPYCLYCEVEAVGSGSRITARIARDGDSREARHLTYLAAGLGVIFCAFSVLGLVLGSVNGHPELVVFSVISGPVSLMLLYGVWALGQAIPERDTRELKGWFDDFCQEIAGDLPRGNREQPETKK